MISNYKRILEEVSNLNVSKKEHLKALLFAFLMAILSVSGIVAIAINLFIFIDLDKLLRFVLASCGVLAFYVLMKVYYKGITKGKIKDINVIYLTDTLIFAIFVYGLYLLTIII